MMHYPKYFILFLILIIGNSLNSQDWLWAKSVYGPNNDEIRAVETDINGNIYIGGRFKDTLFFTDTVYYVALSNYYDGFIAKYDSSGNFIWAETFGGNHNDYVSAIDIDDSSNIYLACYARSSNTVSYGSFSYTGTGNDKTFILKTNSQGVLIWGKLVTHGISNAFPTSIRANAGILALTGTYAYLDLIIESDTLSHKGGNDVFLAVYSSSTSNLLWTRSMTAQFQNYSRYIAIDDSANIYSSGIFHSTMVIGDSIDTLFNPLGYETFLIKHSANGVYQWAKRYRGSGDTELDAMEISPAGNIYIAGYIGYGTHQLNDSNFTTSSGNNFYIQKITTAGNSIWTNIYAGGSLGRIGGMATDQFDNVFISGYLGSNYVFDTISLSGGGSSNYKKFIVKISNNGSVLHGRTGGNYVSNYSLDNLAYSNDGNVYMVGYFASTSGQIAVFDNDSLISYDGRDGFIVKYGSLASTPCNLTASFSETQNSYCQGDTAVFINNSINATNFQWFLNGNPVSISNNFEIILSQSDTSEIMLIANNTICTDTAKIDIYSNPTYIDTVNESICQGDTIWIAQQPYFNQAIHIIKLNSINSCDSTVILDLNVEAVYQQMFYDTICNGDTFFLYGDSIAITQSGIYHENLLTINGCDSINTHNLWVDTLISDFSLQSDTAIANLGYLNYQWLNCDSSFRAISGANSNVFIPQHSGNYAVEISNGICIDTSACKQIIINNLNSISKSENIQIYPNPANDFLNIEVNSENYNLKIYSINSKLLFNKNFSSKQSEINIENLERGVYFLIISEEEGRDKRFKFIKI